MGFLLSALCSACDEAEAAAEEGADGGGTAPTPDARVPSQDALDASAAPDARMLDAHLPIDAALVDAGARCPALLQRLHTLSIGSSCRSPEDCIVIGECNGFPWTGLASDDAAEGQSIRNELIDLECELDIEWDGRVARPRCEGGHCVARMYDQITGGSLGPSCHPDGDPDAG